MCMELLIFSYIVKHIIVQNKILHKYFYTVFAATKKVKNIRIKI